MHQSDGKSEATDFHQVVVLLQDERIGKNSSSAVKPELDPFYPN